MPRWRFWLQIISLLLLCGYGVAVIAPIFASAKAANRITADRQDGKQFARAVQTYALAHAGRLPGEEWRKEVVGVDSSLKSIVQWKDGEWIVGYAAVPGTLGKSFEDLPPETVLFVEYRWVDPIDVLTDVRAIQGSSRNGYAMAITAHDVAEGYPLPLSIAKIGLLLGRQNAPGLE